MILAQVTILIYKVKLSGLNFDRKVNKTLKNFSLEGEKLVCVIINLLYLGGFYVKKIIADQNFTSLTIYCRAFYDIDNS